jgi:DNA-binding transcriptional ArsR family regulator
MEDRISDAVSDYKALGSIQMGNLKQNLQDSDAALDVDAVRFFLYLFAGTQGWSVRINIVLLLKERPSNTNQIASALSLDYKAIQHHLKVLEKNNLVIKQGEKYGIVFFVSPYLESRYQEFQHVVNQLQKSSKKPSFSGY